MADGNFNTGCGTQEVMQPSCDTYSHEVKCCAPVKQVGRPVCNVKFPVPACVPDNRNACAPCDCVPCFDEELAMTPEVKLAVKDMLSALLQTLSPVDRCGCEQISQVGHDLPLKPRQKQDPATGDFLWLETAADGSETETTSAINSVSGLNNTPIFDDICCGAAGNQHSAFLNNGTSSVRFKGGNPPSLFGGMTTGVNSAEFHHLVGELFCCAIAKVDEAPELVVVP